MKIMKSIPFATGAFAAALITFTTATCSAENLYSAAITAKFNSEQSHVKRACHRVNGQKECEDVEVHSIRSFPANNRTLLNLILGRSPLSDAPTNLTFAVAFGCDDQANAQWVIYDKSSSNVVAVIADLTNFDLIHDGKVICTGNGPCEAVDTSFQGFITLSFRSLGAPGTNSIDSGEIRLYVKGSLSPEGCIIKAIGSGSGKIQATADGEEMELFVSNFTLTTGRKLGPLSPPIQTSTGSTSTTINPVSTLGSSSSGLSGYVDTTASVSGAVQVLSEYEPSSAAAWLTTTPRDQTAFDNFQALDPAAVQAALQAAAQAEAERQRPQFPPARP
jgi:hypothetical protein